MTNLAKLETELRTGRIGRDRYVALTSTSLAARRSVRWEYRRCRDKVVQTALKMVIEPIFEREFMRHQLWLSSRQGCKDALRRVERLLKAGYSVGGGRRP